MPAGLRLPKQTDMHRLEPRGMLPTDCRQGIAVPNRLACFEALKKLSIVGIKRGVHCVHQAVLITRLEDEARIG